MTREDIGVRDCLSFSELISKQGSTSTFPDGVPVIRADYADSKSITTATKGQDVVISMVNPIAAGVHQIFIDATLATGVNRLFPAECALPYTYETLKS